jgi:hypothetical protein
MMGRFVIVAYTPLSRLKEARQMFAEFDAVSL